MRSSGLVALLTVSLLCLGASCGQNSSNGTPPTEGPARPANQIEQVEGVDTSELTSDERQLWVDIVNDVLSPCGEPVSVARCASEARSCRQCVPAARYIARLVTSYERRQIEAMFASRFGRDSAVELPIDHAPIRGAPMAPVTIVEFSDFECPHCAAAHPILRRILSEHPAQVRVAFLHYPLTENHPHAAPAARAAVAAQNQGKFWEMHDKLFENQRALEPEDIERYATEIGLDIERFRTDIEAEETQERVDADREAGRHAHIRATPTIFVNGREFHESPSSLPLYIREELDQ